MWHQATSAGTDVLTSLEYLSAFRLCLDPEEVYLDDQDSPFEDFEDPDPVEVQEQKRKAPQKEIIADKRSSKGVDQDDPFEVILSYVGWILGGLILICVMVGVFALIAKKCRSTKAKESEYAIDWRMLEDISARTNKMNN